MFCDNLPRVRRRTCRISCVLKILARRWCDEIPWTLRPCLVVLVYMDLLLAIFTAAPSWVWEEAVLVMA
jgi:hypothetical protein